MDPQHDYNKRPFLSESGSVSIVSNQGAIAQTLPYAAQMQGRRKSY